MCCSFQKKKSGNICRKKSGFGQVQQNNYDKTKNISLKKLNGHNL